MAVKKATVDATLAKVEAATKVAAPEKKAPAKKAPAKKDAPVKAEETKVEEKKTEEKKTEEKKAAPAKKAPAKKTTTKAASAKVAAPKSVKFFVEFSGGQVATDTIVAKAAEVSGKKAIKDLNVYYQPETNMVYFTADGEEGSFSL